MSLYCNGIDCGHRDNCYRYTEYARLQLKQNPAHGLWVMDRGECETDEEHYYVPIVKQSEVDNALQRARAILTDFALTCDNIVYTWERVSKCGRVSAEDYGHAKELAGDYRGFTAIIGELFHGNAYERLYKIGKATEVMFDVADRYEKENGITRDAKFIDIWKEKIGAEKGGQDDIR